MVAVLKQIEIQPVEKPHYNNSAMVFGDWYARNEAAVLGYWNALSQADREAQAGAGCDFQEFAFVQYDVECELVMAARDATYGRARRDF